MEKHIRDKIKIVSNVQSNVKMIMYGIKMTLKIMIIFVQKKLYAENKVLNNQQLNNLLKQHKINNVLSYVQMLLIIITLKNLQLNKILVQKNV